MTTVSRHFPIRAVVNNKYHQSEQPVSRRGSNQIPDQYRYKRDNYISTLKPRFVHEAWGDVVILVKDGQ